MNTAALFSVGRRLALVSLLALCLSGCGSAVTKENYQKIKDGMSESEVANILGSPTKSNDLLGNKIAVWEDDKKAIMITFVNNKVVGHVFVDGEEFAKAMTNMQNSGQPNFNLFDNQKKQETGFKPVPDPVKNNNPNNNPWNMGNNPNNQGKPNQLLVPGVSKVNFDRVQTGMSEAEVVNILGQPSTRQSQDFATFMYWNKVGKTGWLIQLHLHHGKVAGKFSDPELK